MNEQRVRVNLRDQQARDTRARLVEAALDLFARQGVDNTSIKEIARGAGVARGLLYHYFASKDDLLWAVLETNIFTPHSEPFGTPDTARSAEDVLRDIALQFNAFLASRQPLMRVILRELQTNLRVRDLWEDSIRHGVVTMLEDFLCARIASGELRPHRTGITAYMLMYDVVALYLPGGRLGVSNEEAVSEIVEIIVRGIRA